MVTNEKILVAVLLSIGLICSIEHACLAQCNPRSSIAPPLIIRGDLLCHDTTIPTDVEVLEFLVDGVLCPDIDYDFEYPFGSDGYYSLNFWIENNVDHDLSICIRGTCGGTTMTSGFSIDGVSPSPCTTIIVFPAYHAAVLAPILLGQTLPGSSTALHVAIFIMLSILVLRSLNRV